ncbi:MAG: HD domain-containing phosphohydrolase [Acetivibrio sp.]
MKEKFSIYSLEGEELADAIEEDLSDAIRHGILVSNLASSVAKELNESELFIQEIAMAGMLHDIGKLRLSKYLYGRNKDTLQIEEIKYVRMHPTFSYEILKNHDFSESIQQTVYHHHENYDGSGYPDNLKGREIPWGARIIRTCDVFAALVSKRPYREAFEVETAMELMIDEVKNFDMKIFLAFQRVIFSEEFLDIQGAINRINEKENSYRENWMSLFDGVSKEILTNQSKEIGG